MLDEALTTEENNDFVDEVDELMPMTKSKTYETTVFYDKSKGESSAVHSGSDNVQY